VEYEPVIGLEVHAQIQTASKMFCACPAVEDTGDVPPNSFVCPVCAAMPGVLPVINERAVELAVLTGLALNCAIPPYSRFARKSYFYPDLPKGYQISQYPPVFAPLAVNGYLDIKVDGTSRRIRVNRAHLEEDTGKLYHAGDASLVDLNRAGIPLLEIVSEPDLRSVDEVRAYATKLHAILVYLGISSGDMEKGVMRFEANVSVRPAGSGVLNPRHEIKNLNSFRALARSVGYEIEHQIATLRRGGTISQQTMGWNEGKEVTVPQRGKEHADDYRYFPEPDLPVIKIKRELVERLRAALPELPDAKHARFVNDIGLSDYDATVLVADRAVANYFEAAVATGRSDPKTIANWVTGEFFRLLRETDQSVDTIPVSPPALVELIGMVAQDTINASTAKEVLTEMAAAGRSAREIVEERGLGQISDEAALAGVVTRVLDDNPEHVDTYLEGKPQIIGWLIGQVMKSTRGKANPQLARRLLQAQLEARRGQ
jgi:aspartyl-tRNA(Asn)/glutamyl-tRNA(Gln) amidotransferase subunit B